MNRPIGIFDSGVGGLTVVKEIKKLLPHEDIIYFGDTARVPYGTKSKATITRFSIENVHFLLNYNVKMIVVACNTASSLSLEALKRFFKVPIVGVIQPGAFGAARLTQNNMIGVIGTRATISSNAYEKEIKRINQKIRVFSKSCPLFVPLVEEGMLDSDITYRIAEQYLIEMKTKKIDTLILGCTHYPLLKDVVKEVMGKRVNLVDSACEVAKDVRELLLENNILKRNGHEKSKIKFFVSDEPVKFAALGKKFLGYKLESIRKVHNV